MFLNPIRPPQHMTHRSRRYQLPVLGLTIGLLMASIGFGFGSKQIIEAQDRVQLSRVPEALAEVAPRLDFMTGNKVDSLQSDMTVFNLFIIHELSNSQIGTCSAGQVPPAYTGYRAQSPLPAWQGHQVDFQFIYRAPDESWSTVEAWLQNDGSFTTSDPNKVQLIWALPTNYVPQCGGLHRHYHVKMQAVSSFEKAGKTFTLDDGGSLYHTYQPVVDEYKTELSNTNTYCPILTPCGSLNSSGVLLNNSWVQATYFYRSGGQ